jgi:hypothetical protein
MLAEKEADRVWERMLLAEVRSYYFGELASRYTKLKQIITGISFFLSSGAAATLAARLPSWIPLVSAILVAILTAYSIAVGLDKRALAAAKLHSQWNELCAEYEHLWNHWKDADAQEILESLLKRARAASESGVEMPYNENMLQKWTNVVYSRFTKAAA